MGEKKGASPFIKTALVTGGGGFVGQAVVNRLLMLGVETRVFGRHRYPQVEAAGAECFVGDIDNSRMVAEASRGVDVIFHVAALAGIWGKWQAYHATNVVGTENVIKSCLVNKIPMLVYTSTPSVVFTGKDIRDGNEELPYAEKPLCHYARSKILAERMVLDASSDALRSCALRPHLIWGPGDPHLLPRLLARGRKKQLKMIGDGCNLVDISYIDNVAHAHILAAMNLAGAGTACGRAYFISQGSPVNLWGWIAELFAAMDVPPLQATITEKSAYRLGGFLEFFFKLCQLRSEPKMTRFLAEQLAKSHYFSIDRARRELDYQPVVTIEEGLRRTVDWLKTL